MLKQSIVGKHLWNHESLLFGVLRSIQAACSTPLRRSLWKDCGIETFALRVVMTRYRKREKITISRFPGSKEEGIAWTWNRTCCATAFEGHQDAPKERKPGATGSHAWLPWLRESLESSNYVLLTIPVEIHNVGHGQTLTCMDRGRLPEELAVTDQEVESLSQTGLVHRRSLKPRR